MPELPDPQPLGAHLVGSVPLDDTQAVFRTCCEHLGAHLKRLPDGETGSRSNWIDWQRAVFAATPQLEPASDDPAAPFRLQAGMAPEQVVFPQLGYAQFALASYDQFRQLKADGVITAEVRFQVSLPTPLAPVQFYIEGDDRARLEPVYETALLGELDQILTQIPAQELAIQWDTAVEFGVLEGVFPAFLDDPYNDIVERLVRLGERVPEFAELGYHLCYGDAGHQHFVQPQDAGWLTRVANAIFAGVSRRVDWLHLPVPKDRSDVDYFRPLAALSLPSATELYLGLVHATDGAAGAAQRIAAAQQIVSRFGVATECGLGRRPPDMVAPLLALHGQLSQSHR